MVLVGSVSASSSARWASAEDTGPLLCFASSGDVELGLDGRESVREAGGQIAHRDDQAGGAQSRDQPVFNRRRARLVLHKTGHKRVHGKLRSGLRPCDVQTGANLVRLQRTLVG